jgi:hypothetical protein
MYICMAEQDVWQGYGCVDYGMVRLCLCGLVRMRPYENS